MAVRRKAKYVGGYELEEEGGAIIGISQASDWWIHLGDEVVSNGRFEPEGWRGQVIALHEPFEPSDDPILMVKRTTNVIDVRWNNEEEFSFMKFKDLVRPPS